MTSFYELFNNERKELGYATSMEEADKLWGNAQSADGTETKVTTQDVFKDIKEDMQQDHAHADLAESQKAIEQSTKDFNTYKNIGGALGTAGDFGRGFIKEAVKAPAYAAELGSTVLDAKEKLTTDITKAIFPEFDEELMSQLPTVVNDRKAARTLRSHARDTKELMDTMFPALNEAEIQDIMKNPGDVGQYFQVASKVTGESLGSFLPSLAAGGVMGNLAQAGRLQRLVPILEKAKVFGKGNMAAASFGSFLGASAIETAHQSSRYHDEGIDPITNLLASSTYGILAGFVEQGFGDIKVINKLMQKEGAVIGKTLWQKTAKTALETTKTTAGESFEEVIQQGISNAVDNLIGKKTPMTEGFTEGAIGGALGGVGPGLVSGTVQQLGEDSEKVTNIPVHSEGSQSPAQQNQVNPKPDEPGLPPKDLPQNITVEERIHRIRQLAAAGTLAIDGLNSGLLTDPESKLKLQEKLAGIQDEIIAHEDFINENLEAINAELQHEPEKVRADLEMLLNQQQQPEAPIQEEPEPEIPQAAPEEQTIPEQPPIEEPMAEIPEEEPINVKIANELNNRYQGNLGDSDVVFTPHQYDQTLVDVVVTDSEGNRHEELGLDPVYVTEVIEEFTGQETAETPEETPANDFREDAELDVDNYMESLDATVDRDITIQEYEHLQAFKDEVENEPEYNQDPEYKEALLSVINERLEESKDLVRMTSDESGEEHGPSYAEQHEAAFGQKLDLGKTDEELQEQAEADRETRRQIHEEQQPQTQAEKREARRQEREETQEATESTEPERTEDVSGDIQSEEVKSRRMADLKPKEYEYVPDMLIDVGFEKTGQNKFLKKLTETKQLEISFNQDQSSAIVKEFRQGAPWQRTNLGHRMEEPLSIQLTKIHDNYFFPQTPAEKREERAKEREEQKTKDSPKPSEQGIIKEDNKKGQDERHTEARDQEEVRDTQSGKTSVDDSLVQDESRDSSGDNKEHGGSRSRGKSDSDRNGNQQSGKRSEVILPEHKEIITTKYKSRKALREAIEAFINNNEHTKYTQVPQEIIDWLIQYKGAGGEKGATGKSILSEFYTPQFVADFLMNTIAKDLNPTPGRVLEPTIGIGNLVSEFKDSQIVGYEINNVSAEIAALRLPNAKIIQEPFQIAFVDPKTKKPLPNDKNPNLKEEKLFDLVISNPPYGSNRDKYRGWGEGKNTKHYEEYFINRSLDSLKEGGYAIFFIQDSFMMRKSSAEAPIKQLIANKAELMAAFRMPQETFEHTNVIPDILIFKKQTAEEGRSFSNLVDDNYFKKNPDHIIGEVVPITGQYRETTVTGDPVNALTEITIKWSSLYNEGGIPYSNTKSEPEKKDTEEKPELSTKPKTPQAERKKRTPVKKVVKPPKKPVKYETYEHLEKYDKTTQEIWANIEADNTIGGELADLTAEEKLKKYPDLNYASGEVYTDYHYLNGNIYQKLDQLELDREDISESQYKKQQKKLEQSLPEPLVADQIYIPPTSNALISFKTGVTNDLGGPLESDVYGRTIEEGEELNLVDLFIGYVADLNLEQLNGFSANQIVEYARGKKSSKLVKPSQKGATKKEKEDRRRLLMKRESLRKQTGDNLFRTFVSEHLQPSVREQFVDWFNRTQNGNYTPPLDQVPFLVDDVNKYFFDNEFDPNPAQIDVVKMQLAKGASVAALEVGVGKTVSAILSAKSAMDAGKARRPVIIVPKQVIENWPKEIEQLFPNLTINRYGNLGTTVKNVAPQDYSVSLITYQGLEKIWYNPETIQDIEDELINVNLDWGVQATERQRELRREAIRELIGIAEAGEKPYTWDDLEFDYIIVDELHNFRGLFKNASNKNETEKANQKSDISNEYANIGTSGKPSKRAIMLFLATRHIFNENSDSNVLGLSATPFMNSPLEIFSILSLVARNRMEAMGIYNVYDFIDQFVEVDSKFQITESGLIKYKPVVLGFKNARILKSLIREYILPRTAESVGVKRPEKTSLQVHLEPNEIQQEYIQAAEKRATETSRKDPGAALEALHKLRLATISPYMAEEAGYNIKVTPGEEKTNEQRREEAEAKKSYRATITPDEFVEDSPKLEYITESIATVLKDDPNTSQLVYMPLGKSWFGHIKEYLVRRKGLKESEVALVQAGLSDDKLDKIQDGFNKGDIKIIIGTSKMKEGMNLNKNSSVLYVAGLDWNPTDLVQIEGRIHRQGNPYEKVRVVYPLLSDSVDPLMYQKLDAKIKRFNNIWEGDEDYVNTEEIDPEEIIRALIRNPERKAVFLIEDKKMTLQEERRIVRIKQANLDFYPRELQRLKDIIKNTEEKIANEERFLSIKEKPGVLTEDQWKKRRSLAKANITRHTKRIPGYKEDVNVFLQDLKNKNISLENLEEIKQRYEDEVQEINAQILGLENKKDDYIREFEEEEANRVRKTLSDHLEEVKELNKTHLIKKPKPPANQTYKAGSISASISAGSSGTIPKKPYENATAPPDRQQIITDARKIARERRRAITKSQQNLENVDEAVEKVLEALKRNAANIELRIYKGAQAKGGLEKATNLIAKKHKKKGVTGEMLRAAIIFDRESVGFPVSRPDLKEAWDQIPESDKRHLRGVRSVLDDLMEEGYKEYQQNNGKDYEDYDDIENYITHLWDIPNKYKALMVSYFTTKSRFAKQRMIESYKEGMDGITLKDGTEIKFKPKVLDYGEIAMVQINSMARAVENKKVADLLNSLRVGDVPLVERADRNPGGWIGVDHPALKKTMIIPGEPKVGHKLSAELQNMLYDMGVAVGRRINSKAFGKPVSREGQYKAGVPAEVRFQRFFSEKALGHEIGHHIDNVLGLGQDFWEKHKKELWAINQDRVEAFRNMSDRKKSYKMVDYAETTEEQIAEFISFVFNDPEFVQEKAPKAMSDFLKRMNTDESFKKLLPENFDWKRAKIVVEEVTTTMIKMPVVVHPALESPIKFVFERDSSSDIGKFILQVNAAQKKMILSISLFHAFALAQSALGTVGLGKTLTILNPIRAFKDIRDFNYGAFRDSALTEHAIKHRLQIGDVADVQRSVVDNTLEKWATLNSDKPGWKQLAWIFRGPGIAAKWVNSTNDKWLWDYLHTEYKLLAYQMIGERMLNDPKKKGMSEKEVYEEAAKFVNDAFGGQAWESISFKVGGKVQMFTPKRMRAAQMTLLSPDWFYSTTLQATALLGVGGMNKEGKGLRQKEAIRYWVKAAVYMAVFMNVVNAAMRLWDKADNPEKYKDKDLIDYTIFGNPEGHQLHIFAGTYPDGKERYLRILKQFTEIPEMVAHPLKKMGGKVSPIWQLGSKVFAGHSLSGFEDKDYIGAMKDGNIADKTYQLGRVGFQSFLPISVQNMTKSYKPFSPTDIAFPSSFGMSYSKGEERYKKLLYGQHEKDFSESTIADINHITDDLIDNNIDALSVVKNAANPVEITSEDQQRNELKSDMRKKLAEGKDIGNSPLARDVKKQQRKANNAINRQVQNKARIKNQAIRILQRASRKRLREQRTR